MHAQYGKDVEFLVVYIKEAHPLDGEMPLGGDGNPIVEQPITFEERKAVAGRCAGALDMSPMTMLIDDMDDSTNLSYAGFPDRLFLVGKDGKVSYSGGRGPMGFRPDELEDSIRETLGMPKIEREERDGERRRRGGDR